MQCDSNQKEDWTFSTKMLIKNGTNYNFYLIYAGCARDKIRPSSHAFSFLTENERIQSDIIRKNVNGYIQQFHNHNANFNFSQNFENKSNQIYHKAKTILHKKIGMCEQLDDLVIGHASNWFLRLLFHFLCSLLGLDRDVWEKSF